MYVYSKGAALMNVFTSDLSALMAAFDMWGVHRGHIPCQTSVSTVECGDTAQVEPGHSISGNRMISVLAAGHKAAAWPESVPGSSGAGGGRSAELCSPPHCQHLCVGHDA